MKPAAALSLCIVALCCVAVIVAAGFWGYSYDDAFITYLYARRWLEEGLLRYNAHETVLGTTAPGYALLLGLTARLSTPFAISIPQLATAISVASLLVTALSPLLVRSRESIVERCFLALLFGVLVFCLRWNVELLGSEFFPATALAVLGGLLLLERDRVVPSALLLSGAAILRFELVLAALAFGFVRFWRRDWPPVGFLAALLAPLAFYCAFLELEFGRIVPHTLDVHRFDFASIHQNYFLAEWKWLRRALPAASSVALLGLALVGLAAALRPSSRPLVVALAAWLVAHEAVYRLLSVPFSPWYHVPTLLGVLFLAVLGAERIARMLTGNARAATVLLLAPLLVPAPFFVIEHWGSPPDPRFRIYAEVGRFLRERSRPDDLVAAVEIGPRPLARFPQRACRSV